MPTMEGWWAASYVILWCVVIALVILCVALARQIGILHLRIAPTGALEVDDEGPPLGEAPSPIDATDSHGAGVTIGGPGDPQFVLFVSAGCRICHEVIPGLKPAAQSSGLRPILITDDLDSRDGLRSHGPQVVASTEAASYYNVPGTPYAVITDGAGVVRAKGTVNNIEQMEGLVDTAGRRVHEVQGG